MSSEKPIVSPSPHLHGPESTRRVMGDVLIALLPVASWYHEGQTEELNKTS